MHQPTGAAPPSPTHPGSLLSELPRLLLLLVLCFGASSLASLLHLPHSGHLLLALLTATPAVAWTLHRGLQGSEAGGAGARSVALGGRFGFLVCSWGLPAASVGGADVGAISQAVATPLHPGSWPSLLVAIAGRSWRLSCVPCKGKRTQTCVLLQLNARTRNGAKVY